MKRVIVHRIEKSTLATIGDILNILIIGASVYYTYRKLLTPFVQAARVDWKCYSAEVIVNGKEYHLDSIDDEVPLAMGYWLKFDSKDIEGSEFVRLIVTDRNDNEFECIQKHRV
jgi:hypothetical protein